MPWLGYFHKMAQCDIFVLLDSVQFKKNNWQNRNRIIDRNGSILWLTVPVFLKGHLSSTIKDTRIQNELQWGKKYWGRIHGSYCKHPFYNKYKDRLHDILFTNYTYLIELNFSLILFFREIFRINNRLVWASDLDVKGRSTELLINICRTLGGSTYLSGPDGQKYMGIEQFEKSKISLEFHRFTHPIYEAKHFEPSLSSLDLIMNHGNKSSAILGIE